jgi:hypothetical protein
MHRAVTNNAGSMRCAPGDHIARTGSVDHGERRLERGHVADCFALIKQPNIKVRNGACTHFTLIDQSTHFPPGIFDGRTEQV